MTTVQAPAARDRGTSAPSIPDELATRRVLPRRHPVRWVVSAVVVVLLAELVHTIASNPSYQWGVFDDYFTRPFLLRGLVLTLQVTLYSAVLGFLFGVLLAVARLASNQLLNGLAWGYIWFFRSLPLPVLLVILFNLVAFFPTLGLAIPFGPTLFATPTGTLLTPLAAGVLGLALNEAAFAAELIRGGLVSVDAGQQEAAHALGLSPWRRLRRVVLPQALRAIVPGYVNQLIGLVKASSLVYYVSLIDIFGAVYVLESRIPNDIVPILLAGSAWYLVIAAVLSVVQFHVERYFARGALRTLPPTPWQRLRAAAGAARLRGEATR